LVFLVQRVDPLYVGQQPVNRYSPLAWKSFGLKIVSHHGRD
jgi:hypothetical protein